MIKPKSHTIIWDRVALDHFKDILDFLSKQSSRAPRIVREGILSRLDTVKKNGRIGLLVIPLLETVPNDFF